MTFGKNVFCLQCISILVHSITQQQRLIPVSYSCIHTSYSSVEHCVWLKHNLVHKFPWWLGMVSQTILVPRLPPELLHAPAPQHSSGAPVWLSEPLGRKLDCNTNPSLVAVELSVGYQIWPPIVWHCPFLIGWSKHKLGIPQLQCIMGSWCDRRESFHNFSKSLCTALTSGKLPAVRAVQGDCERVYEEAQ